MRFDNAFLTTNNNVGMQFTNKRKEVLTIWDDGKRLHFSEGFSKSDVEQAIHFYNENKGKYYG